MNREQAHTLTLMKSSYALSGRMETTWYCSLMRVEGVSLSLSFDTPATPFWYVITGYLVQEGGDVASTGCAVYRVLTRCSIGW